MGNWGGFWALSGIYPQKPNWRRKRKALQYVCVCGEGSLPLPRSLARRPFPDSIPFENACQIRCGTWLRALTTYIYAKKGPSGIFSHGEVPQMYPYFRKVESSLDIFCLSDCLSYFFPTTTLYQHRCFFWLEEFVESNPGRREE